MGNNKSNNEISVADFSLEDLKKIFVEKAREMGILMAFYCTPEDSTKRTGQVIKSLKDKCIGYSNFRNMEQAAVDNLNSYATAPESLIQDVELLRRGRINDETYLDSLLQDDLEFLRFFTTYGDHRGLECNEGNKKLFEGMTKAFDYSVMSVLRGKRRKEGKYYREPDEIREYTESTPLRNVQIRDIVTMDMLDIFGNDVTQMYFKGQGEELYNRLVEYFNNSETTIIEASRFDDTSMSLEDYAKYKAISLSDSVDESVNHNDETNFARYSNSVKELSDVSKGYIERPNKSHNVL